LKELLPEFSNKRKPDFNTRQDTWPNKTPRYSVNNNMNTNNNLSNDNRRSGFSVNKPTFKFTPRYQQKFAKGRDSDKKENNFKDKKSGSVGVLLFGSPKRTTVDWNLKVSLYLNQAEIPIGGRLRFFLENWNKITDDQWVLSIILEGYKLEFIQKPPQSKIRKLSFS
jgi:hypothetical protein